MNEEEQKKKSSFGFLALGELFVAVVEGVCDILCAIVESGCD